MLSQAPWNPAAVVQASECNGCPWKSALQEEGVGPADESGVRRESGKAARRLTAAWRSRTECWAIKVQRSVRLWGTGRARKKQQGANRHTHVGRTLKHAKYR